MTDDFSHRTSLEVRFRDIDAFGHVNNAVVLSYVELARVRYLHEVLEIDDREHVERLPVILARVAVDFRAPIAFGAPVEVATRVTWIGRTSFGMAHRVQAGRRTAAEVESVIVTYDYASARPMPVPDDWRERFAAREGRDLARATETPQPATAGAGANE